MTRGDCLVINRLLGRIKLKSLTIIGELRWCLMLAIALAALELELLVVFAVSIARDDPEVLATVARTLADSVSTLKTRRDTSTS